MPWWCRGSQKCCSFCPRPDPTQGPSLMAACSLPGQGLAHRPEHLVTGGSGWPSLEVLILLSRSSCLRSPWLRGRVPGPSCSAPTCSPLQCPRVTCGCPGGGASMATSARGGTEEGMVRQCPAREPVGSRMPGWDFPGAGAEGSRAGSPGFSPHSRVIPSGLPTGLCSAVTCRHVPVCCPVVPGLGSRHPGSQRVIAHSAACGGQEAGRRALWGLTQAH